MGHAAKIIKRLKTTVLEQISREEKKDKTVSFPSTNKKSMYWLQWEAMAFDSKPIQPGIKLFADRHRASGLEAQCCHFASIVTEN